MTSTKIAELINQNNFVNILINELYSLIDEELAKDMEMDCDLIDELVNAIETLEHCENENPAIILPLIFADNTILSKRIRNRVNNQKTFTRITALAASFAIFLSGVNHIPATEDKSVLVYAVDAVLESISKVFGVEFHNNTNTDEKAEESTTKETTTETIESTTILEENIVKPEETTTIIEENITEETTTIIEESTVKPEESTTIITDNFNEKEETTTSPIIEEITKEPEIQEIIMLNIELVTNEDFKTSYLWKEELDLTGLKVVAVYSDSSQKEIPIKDCKISGFNSLKVGEQTVTVKYNELSATFKVTVSKTEQNDEVTRTITNIECKVKDEAIIVPKGTENPAYYEKVQYRYAYSDGTFSAWKVCKDAELISEYNNQLIDVPQTLTYRTPEGWEFTVNVIVYDYSVIVPDDNTLNISRLEITKIPDALKYYPTNLYKCYTYVGEEIDLSQFEIKVFYKDGSFKYRTIEDSKIQVYGTTTTERPSSSKGYTITFAYGKATVDFCYDVLIEPEIQSISIDNSRWDVYYINNAPKEYNAEKLVT
ncbi:MAG: bacterial Ig-like domain-containing protein, partial [Clostridia bacterium]|nr:bacterial Ig-like domain-containing protein [Clostridia bacterium]